MVEGMVIMALMLMLIKIAMWTGTATPTNEDLGKPNQPHNTNEPSDRYAIKRAEMLQRKNPHQPPTRNVIPYYIGGYIIILLVIGLVIKSSVWFASPGYVYVITPVFGTPYTITNPQMMFTPFAHRTSYIDSVPMKYMDLERQENMMQEHQCTPDLPKLDC